MRLTTALLAALSLSLSLAQSDTESESATGTESSEVSSTSKDYNPRVSFSETSELEFYTGSKKKTTRSTGVPSGAYVTYASRITLTGANNENEVTTMTLTDFGTPEATPGTPATPTGSSTHSSTQRPQPTNTQPCNNYVELCKRKYGNITHVGCHNSPFVRPGNSGSNQELPVEDQLNDGVRFLQAQIQWPENGTTPHFCHTSCDLLDAGPITSWLTRVRKWVDSHPYDVVTILLGNGNYSKPELYAPYIESTGITKYAYQAPYLPMKRDDWPSLEYLILRGKRVIMFMDYEANQTAYPWLLDQFSQMSETPFDPLDRSFPCTIQRPPDMDKKKTKERLYLMNHNLNAEFNVFDVQLLVPAVSLLNETNAAEGYGSLGLAANNCRSEYDGVPPNILNVDYYNYGSYPGSVFEAAARINNVTYKNGTCCGVASDASETGVKIRDKSWAGMVVLGVVAVMFL